MAMTERYAERVAASYARIEDVFRHRDNGVVPFQVADVNYWLSGETPALIPDDYFTNCQSMLAYQVKKIAQHMEIYDDDYIPFLFPWYGTGVLPSALGAEILFQPKMDPAVRGTVVNSPEHLSRLSLPDPRKDGLMLRVLETIRYFREHSDLPISFTDPQGPFTTALTLAGPGTLFVWLYEYPKAVHELMEFCTEAFIRWIKVQKEEIGPEQRPVLLPARHHPAGAVWPRCGCATTTAGRSRRSSTASSWSPTMPGSSRSSTAARFISAAAPSTRSRTWPPRKGLWA